MDPAAFDRENYLQQYIYDNPDSIPLYDIKEDIKLLILAREFPTNSGPIDAIGTDRNGEIYLIETKLYKNPDKRTVVAQVLDYGASLWRWSRDFSEFTNILNQEVNKRFGLTLQEKLKQFFSITDEETASLLDSISRNLDQGNFKFVVLMDQLESRLKDLIVFVNENSKFDLYAVELEYYKHEDYEIMIPKLFGAEVKKDIKSSGSSGSRRRWNEQEVLEEAARQLDFQELAAFEKIYAFVKQTADHINFGTGSYATFSPIFSKISNKTLFTVGTDKRLSFNFDWVYRDNQAAVVKFKDELERIGFVFEDDYIQTRPSVLIDQWAPKTEAFIQAVKNLLKEF